MPTGAWVEVAATRASLAASAASAAFVYPLIWSPARALRMASALVRGEGEGDGWG